MSAYTIHVSISIDNEIEPIEFNFLSEKLNWNNLVTLIQSTTNSIETPVIFYYKKDNSDVIESLENQEQLESLLLIDENVKGLRFYGKKDLVNEHVFVYPGNTFIRLAQLVDENKEIVSSSRRIARLVGILTTFIAEDTTDYGFGYEFEVLEKLIKRKIDKRSRRQQQPTNGGDSNINDEEQEEHQRDDKEDPRKALLGPHGPFSGRRGVFGGRGAHGRHHHHPEDMFSGCGGPFGGHNDPFGDHSSHFGSRSRGGFFGRGGLFGGRGGGRGGFFAGRGEFFGGHGRHHPSFVGDYQSPFGNPGEVEGDFFNGGGGHYEGRFDQEFGPFFDSSDKKQNPFKGEKATSDDEDLNNGHGPFGKGFNHFHHGGPGFNAFGGYHFHHGNPFGKRGGKHDFDGCDKKKYRRRGYPYGFSRGSSSEDGTCSKDEMYAIREHLLKNYFKHDKAFKRHHRETHFHCV